MIKWKAGGTEGSWLTSLHSDFRRLYLPTDKSPTGIARSSPKVSRYGGDGDRAGPQNQQRSPVTFFTRERQTRVICELSALPDCPPPAQGTRMPECCIFKYFWLSPLATYVSNIPSWLPHAQALASSPLYCRVLCCFKDTVGPRSSRFSSVFS